MPKKFKGENSKAVVAKARKAEAALEEKSKKDKAIEDAFWQDDDKQIQKKLARKDDREKKRLAELEKKAELRALADAEEEAIVPKTKPTPQKITQFEVQRNVELRAAQESEEKKMANESVDEIPLVENLNRLEQDVISASGIDAAVEALSMDSPSTELPGKRMAAAFRAFEEKRLPQIRKENPNLRMSQQKQMLRKEWQKSPDNPLNRT